MLEFEFKSAEDYWNTLLSYLKGHETLKGMEFRIKMTHYGTNFRGEPLINAYRIEFEGGRLNHWDGMALYDEVSDRYLQWNTEVEKCPPQVQDVYRALKVCNVTGPGEHPWYGFEGDPYFLEVYRRHVEPFMPSALTMKHVILHSSSNEVWGNLSLGCQNESQRMRVFIPHPESSSLPMLCIDEMEEGSATCRENLRGLTESLNFVELLERTWEDVRKEYKKLRKLSLAQLKE